MYGVISVPHWWRDWAQKKTLSERRKQILLAQIQHQKNVSTPHICKKAALSQTPACWLHLLSKVYETRCTVLWQEISWETFLHPEHLDICCVHVLLWSSIGANSETMVLIYQANVHQNTHFHAQTGIYQFGRERRAQPDLMTGLTSHTQVWNQPGPALQCSKTGKFSLSKLDTAISQVRYSLGSDISLFDMASKM